MLDLRNTRTRLAALSASTLVAILIACAPDAPTFARPSSRSVRYAAKASQHIPMLDELLEEVNRRAPGFGGMYRSSSNSMSIWITSKGEASAIEIAARAVFAAYPWSKIAEIRFLPARFEVLELQALRNKYQAELNPSLLWTDFDEAANQVVVGLDEQADVQAEASRARNLGAMEGMIVFVREPRPKPMGQWLDAAHRPVVGGVAIQVYDSTDNSALHGCTLGFNVRLSDASGEYFVTNSHCTSNYWAVNHDSAFQFTHGGTAAIGVEFRDLPLRSDISGCPNWTPTGLCRYSDAAIFRYTSDSYSNFPYIAKTDGLTSTLGVNGSRWRVDSFVVTQDYAEATLLAADTAVGDTWLQKVGNTTGWTWRFIDHTCYDIVAGGGMLRCQYRVAAQADTGDSGSPVFYWYATVYGVNQAWLAGILHSSVASSYFAFSSIAGIKNDYPTLSTH